MKSNNLLSGKYFDLALAVIFFTASFFFRFVSYNQTPFANGWDSYFYLIQVKALLEEGSMHSKDLSLIYPLMSFIQVMVDDYVLTYKLTSAILAGLFSVIIYLLSLKWSGDRSMALIFGCFTLFSPHLTYFSGQYPKNMLGVILFLLFVLNINNKKIFIPIILLLLNFFGHRLTAILSILFGILYIFLKKRPAVIGVALLGIFILFLIGGIFLPGILSVADVERFENVIVLNPHFSPYSFIASFENISTFWIVEIIFASIIHFAGIFVTVKYFFKNNTEPLLSGIVIVCLFLVFPFLSWSMESIGYRLFLVYVLIAPLVIIYFKRFFLIKSMVVVLSVGLFSISFFSFKSYNPEKHDPPYDLYHNLSEKIFKKVSKDEIELIIAHKSLAEYITFYSGVDAMSWIPEYKIDKEKLWRIAADINEMQLNYYLREEGDSSSCYKLSPHYYLIKEADWQKLMKKIKEDNDVDLIQYLDTWKNPSKVRPYYLLKNKR